MRRRDTDGRVNPYRFKLNTLGAGRVMTLCAAGLAALGGFCLLPGWETAARVLFGLAGLVFGLLLVLVAVELHQDKVITERSLRENAAREDARLR